MLQHLQFIVTVFPILYIYAAQNYTVHSIFNLVHMCLKQIALCTLLTTQITLHDNKMKSW